MALPNFIDQLGEQVIRGPSVQPTLYTEKVKLDAIPDLPDASRRVFAFGARIHEGLGEIQRSKISRPTRS
jgi:hypothetical protein